MEEKELRQDVFNRLSKFKEQTGLTLNAFAGSIGMKHATLHNQFHGKRDLSLETIMSTLSAYKELSAEWLLRGCGDMFATNETTSDENTRKYEERIKGLLETIQILSDTIRVKSRTIDDLSAELSQLKNGIKEA